MTTTKENPGAVNAGEVLSHAVEHDLFTLLPASSQHLAPLLRETEGKEKAQLLQAFNYFRRRGVPADVHFEIHYDESPEWGALIEMDYQGERVMVLVLDWRPSVNFNAREFMDIVTAAWTSDEVREDVLYSLRSWSNCKGEIINDRERAALVKRLEAEHHGFERLMKPLLDAPHDPRRWFMPPMDPCPIFIAPAPAKRAAR